MPGMLTEAQTPQSSGPVSQTPPPADPGAGNSPSEGAAGPGQPPSDQDFETLRDEAVQLVYGERFDQLIKMFQTNGAEKFPRSMAITINTAITELEKTKGAIPPEMAAEIGMDLMVKLLEDIISGGVLPDVQLEQIQEVLPAVLVMYSDSHPNVRQEDIQAVMAEVQQGIQGAPEGAAAGGGEMPPPDAGAPPAPAPGAPPPGMAPPPPGVV